MPHYLDENIAVLRRWVVITRFPAIPCLAMDLTDSRQMAKLERCQSLITTPINPGQRIGGEHFRHPVLSIVCQASMALCRSIRRRVCGIG